ncbi:MAG: DGQHR domain-containing protein [Ignavibacterium album]|uniref:DNA sulfur modification protein DndB n=1 Tax=Ignavibacterium album TaxID=591197 RepID=UPI0026E9E312|nr:DNA sulfur modification protein DndB [Ignavibacterium album]MCX8106658.1 DGQHR domain-containing protein [Ignavibacterium album]
MSKGKLILPTLRAHMGDWIYYVSIMTFEEISNRLSMADEIRKSEGLKTLIQREVKNRTKEIVEYLKNQEQRFFNSIIIGLYGGNPKYQEITVEQYSGIGEKELNYLNKAFGILTLDGNEKLFAIDGQHRTKAIKESLKEKSTLSTEENSVIFIAHKTSPEGLIRTRRLFSTLNRYAKPVSKSEIIAIDEEDNCAIITRNLVEDFKLLKDIVLFNQNRSISNNNSSSFTNIIVLYDFITTILTNQKVFGYTVTGEDYLFFTHRRTSEEVIYEKQKIIENLLTEIFKAVPSLNRFLRTKFVDRKLKTTSLLFKPIGQNILYQTLKLAMEHKKKDKLLNYFAKDNFNLQNKIWKKVFLDEETGRIKTDKELQKYAFYLILKSIGVNLPLTTKDQKVYDNFNIDPSDL